MVFLQLFGILSSLLLGLAFFPYGWFEKSKKTRKVVGIDLARQSFVGLYSEDERAL